jgi:hypothetical protein
MKLSVVELLKILERTGRKLNLTALNLPRSNFDTQDDFSLKQLSANSYQLSIFRSKDLQPIQNNQKLITDNC